MLRHSPSPARRKMPQMPCRQRCYGYGRTFAKEYFEVPAAYCLSAIRNICLTESARASRKIPLDTTREIPTGDGGTEKAIELNEVTATLRRLPEKERKAVEMSAFAGCSADDIAEVLGVSAVNADRYSVAADVDSVHFFTK